jgi:hypothetical protein
MLEVISVKQDIDGGTPLRAAREDDFDDVLVECEGFRRGEEGD